MATSTIESPATRQPASLIERGKSLLIWGTGTLAAAMLLAAVLLFVGAVFSNGADGAALLYDFYHRALSTCL